MEERTGLNEEAKKSTTNQEILIEQNERPQAAPKLTSQQIKKQKMAKMPKQLDCSQCKKQVWTNYSYQLGACGKWSAFLLFLFGGCCCLCCIPLRNEKFKEIHHSCPRCRSVLLVIKPFSDNP